MLFVQRFLGDEVTVTGFVEQGVFTALGYVIIGFPYCSPKMLGRCWPVEVWAMAMDTPPKSWAMVWPV